MNVRRLPARADRPGLVSTKATARESVRRALVEVMDVCGLTRESAAEHAQTSPRMVEHWLCRTDDHVPTMAHLLGLPEQARVIFARVLLFGTSHAVTEQNCAADAHMAACDAVRCAAEAQFYQLSAMRSGEPHDWARAERKHADAKDAHARAEMFAQKRRESR